MRSSDPRQLQKTPAGDYSPEVAVNPQGPGRGQSVAPAQLGGSPRGTDGTNLMEQVLGRQNMMDALKRVKQNGGAPGVDGVPTTKLADQIEPSGLVSERNCSRGPTDRCLFAVSKSRNPAAVSGC